MAFILYFRSLSVATKSFSEWYELGRLSYLDNDWVHCVEGFEKALQAFKSYQKINLSCKKKCQQEAQEETMLQGQDPSHLDNDLQFYSQKIFYTLCSIKCKSTSKSYVKDDDFASKEVLQHFEALEPYNYLQLCYFQVSFIFGLFSKKVFLAIFFKSQLKQYSKALEAAFTYYVTNYDDQTAKANLEYYMEITGKSYQSIKNAEAFVSSSEKRRSQENTKDSSFPL